MLYGFLLAALVIADVWRLPWQLTDNASYLLRMSQAPLSELLARDLQPGQYFRPLHFATGKLLYDLTGEPALWVFKLFHSAQLVTLVILFGRLLSVDNAGQAAMACLGYTILFGLHTFAALVVETYPVNSGLSVGVLALAVANLARSRPAPWKGALAVALLVYAALAVEVGLLLWVVIAAGYLARWPGITRSWAIGSAGVVALYFVGRFLLIQGSLPDLQERDVGWGFRVLTPTELQAMLGERRLMFYAYNVISTVLSIVISEPRNGVFLLVRGLVSDELAPWVALNVVTSAATSVLIVWTVMRMWPRWQPASWTDSERLVLVSAAVILANTAFAFSYTRDRIVTTAGIYYGLASAVALRELVIVRWTPRVAAALATVVFALGLGWSVRFAGLHWNLEVAAWRQQNDWIEGVEFLREQGVIANATDEAFIKRLQDEALAAPVRVSVFPLSRYEVWFDRNN